MAGDYKMGMVDATVESSLAQKYGVNGWVLLRVYVLGFRFWGFGFGWCHR